MGNREVQLIRGLKRTKGSGREGGKNSTVCSVKLNTGIADVSITLDLRCCKSLRLLLTLFLTA